jgi:hypothetical protein
VTRRPPHHTERGDVSGYRELWSRRSFTYFDGDSPHRIEDDDTIGQLLDALEGKLHADSYNFYAPRVQFGIDTAPSTSCSPTPI